MAEFNLLLIYRHQEDKWLVLASVLRDISGTLYHGLFSEGMRRMHGMVMPHFAEKPISLVLIFVEMGRHHMDGHSHSQ